MPSNYMWAERSLAELALIGSGTRPPNRTGPIPVMGANGQIGTAERANFGPGYLVGRVGAAGAVNRVEERCWASDNTLTVEPRQGAVDDGFLGHLLRFLRPEQLATKNAQPLVTQSNLLRLTTRVPVGILEQHCIAEILDTVDEAIRNTEQVIAKLQGMKQGLLHDLLTRGIDENGELRDPERHPEQFKDSQLGTLPTAWGVTSLGEVARRGGGLIQTGPFGSQLHAHEYVNEGVPVVMPQDIVGDRISKAQVARITQRRARDLVRHRLKANDTIFSRRGDLSRCAPISSREEGWLCGTGCLLVRGPHDVLLAEWLAAVYRHDMAQRQILGRAVGSTMVNLNTTILASLVIPLPTDAEQTAAVARMAHLRDRLGSEQDLVVKLRVMKNGLMDDLLTGRVRVRVAEGAAA